MRCPIPIMGKFGGYLIPGIFLWEVEKTSDLFFSIMFFCSHLLRPFVKFLILFLFKNLILIGHIGEIIKAPIVVYINMWYV